MARLKDKLTISH